MPHSQSFDAVVLKTYDVGEADRFCILFTRERGRMSARAAGARRLQSKLGGSLLPFSRLTVELKESGAAWIVCGASGRRETSVHSIGQFMMLEEGIELLLRLVTDEDPLPHVFDATLAFFDACREDIPHASLAYSFALLHHLGFLPEEGGIQALQPLTSAGHAYMESSCAGNFLSPEPGCNTDQLYTLQSMLLEEHMSSPLRARGVIQAMG